MLSISQKAAARILPIITAFALAVLPTGVYAQVWDPTPDPDIDARGDKSRVPIVFVHGASGAGEQFERQAMHFTSNGYPPSWIVAIDRSTAGVGGPRRGAAPGAAPGAPGLAAGQRPAGAPPAPGPGGPGANLASSESVQALDKFIDDLRARTGHNKVNLVGHSAGTAVSAAYLSDPARAAKIAHYASVGGGPATNPNGVPSIAVSGLGDNGRGPSASNGGQVAWMPDYQDHVMVCTSDESFWAIYTFFNDGEKPKTMRITPEERPQVGGYVKSYIVNKPLPNAKVEVWEVAKDTGRRKKKVPTLTFDVAEDGKWGPFTAKPGQYYEFVVHDENLPYPRHYYREPFDHTNLLVYFRISSTAEGYSPSPFDRDPKFYTDKNSVFVVRHQNGAWVPGVTFLKVNGIDLIVDPIMPTTTTPRQAATVGLYLADANGNGKTDLTRIEEFGGAFVAGADVFIPADKNKSVEFRLNDRVINVPAWKGTEAGHIQVVFNDFN